MSTQTVIDVNEETREWTSDDGKLNLAFITITFEDGVEGSVACKPGNEEKVKDILKGLMDKPTDGWDLEEKAAFQGVPQAKVKQYPGKPQGQGGGGGGGGYGGGGPRVDDPATRASIEAQKAMGVAAALASNAITAGVMDPVEALAFVGSSTPILAAVLRATGAATVAAGTPAGTSTPGTGEKPAQGNTGGSIEGLRAEAEALFGTKARVQIAYKRAYGEPGKFDEMSEAELSDLMDAKRSEDEGAQS